MSPLFSRSTAERLSHRPENAAKLSQLQRMFRDFTLQQDSQLVALVNAACAKTGADPLTLSPEDINPGPTDLMHYRSLDPSIVDLRTLRLRFMLLRSFNRRLAAALPLIDLSCADYESALSSALRRLRGLVFSSVKRALFERVLGDSHCGDDASLQRKKEPTVILDRNRAAQHLKTGRADVKGNKSVFGQIFTRLARANAGGLRNSHRAWYTILAGENSDDYGGPYNEVFNQASQELMSHALPLLLPCPNNVADSGQNREKWILNPQASGPTATSMFEFVGKTVRGHTHTVAL